MPTWGMCFVGLLFSSLFVVCGQVRECAAHSVCRDSPALTLSARSCRVLFVGSARLPVLARRRQQEALAGVGGETSVSDDRRAALVTSACGIFADPVSVVARVSPSDSA